MRTQCKSKLLACVFIPAVLMAAASPATAALIAPSGLTSEAGAFAGVINLSWVNNQPSPPLGHAQLILYQIGVYRSIGSGAWTRIATLASTSTQHTISPATRETSYRFRVRLEPGSLFAVANYRRALMGLPSLDPADYTSPYSNILPVYFPRAARPSNMSCVATSTTRITINWQVNEPGAMNTVVKISKKPGNYYEMGTEFLVAAPSTSFVAIDLEPNTTYGIRVKSIDGFNYSSDWTGLQDCATLAVKPASLRALVASDGMIHVAWRNATQNSGMKVMTASGEGPWVFSQVDAAPSTPEVVEGLLPGTLGLGFPNPLPSAKLAVKVQALNPDGAITESSLLVIPANAAAAPTKAQIDNGAQLPLGSVVVDGMEMLTGGRRIPANGSAWIQLAAGTHTITALLFNPSCGFSTFEFPGTGAVHSFTVMSNTSTLISIPAITLAAALSRGTGRFTAVDGFGDWYAFRSDGSWSVGLYGDTYSTGTFGGAFAAGVSTVQLTWPESVWNPVLNQNETIYKTVSVVFNECDGTLTVPGDSPNDDLIYRR